MSIPMRLKPMLRKKTFDKQVWSKVYNHERREWYKSRGICAECGAAWAAVGRVNCPDCIAKQRERYNARKDERNAADRQRRQDRINAGKCAVCGKRTPRPGKRTCTQCAKKQHDRDMNRIVKKRMAKWRIESGQA